MQGALNDITSGFESVYNRLRQQEARAYTDEEVARLPRVSSSHPHFKEWQIRKASSQRLLNYLQAKKRPLSILEPGCGNGWLSHQLASLPASRIIGTDINLTEIKQAATVFHDQPNLYFIYGDAQENMFEEMQFDIIVFAASIQYFPDVTDLIRNTLKLLKPTGEIHIIDSHFYPPAGLDAARQRSRLYYQVAGFPEMTKRYFHHSLDPLRPFNYTIRYDPTSLRNKLLRNKNPFYWIRIQK